MSRTRAAAHAALAALLFAPALAAQERVPRSRMDALIRAVRSDERDRVATFLPRAGDWRLVETTSVQGSGRVVGMGVWRFPAAQTLRAISEGGPACGTFDPSDGGYGVVGSLGFEMSVDGPGNPPRGWRRVGANRFVPPEAPAGSPFFVEWRREGRRWVVSGVGEERSLPDPSPVPDSRPHPGGVQMSTVPPASPALAGEAEWFRGRVPLVLHSLLYLQNGPPVQLAPDELEQIGVKEGVPVYVARGHAREPETVYVPVDGARFQPYALPHGWPQPCR